MSRRANNGEQLGMVCDGMMPAAATEENMADIFAVWVDRIADVNATIALLLTD